MNKQNVIVCDSDIKLKKTIFPTFAVFGLGIATVASLLLVVSQHEADAVVYFCQSWVRLSQRQTEKKQLYKDFLAIKLKFFI